MDIKVLRNFVEIVDSGSLTAASKKLFIAQPALSNQLKSLEKEMNTTLIERNSRHQKMTDAGKLFYERAKSIILLENSMIKEVKDAIEGNVGCLKIASIHSGEMTLLQEIIPRFTKKYPNINYEIYEKESDVILSMLEDGVVDIGIVRTPCSLTPEMEISYISDERLVCVYDPQVFHFDTEKNAICFSELGDKPLLIIRRYEEMIRELCKKEFFSPRIRCINQQLNITLNWAESGLGVAIVPEDMLAHCSKTMAYKAFSNDAISTKRAIVTMKNAFHSKAMKHFLEICLDLL